MKVIIIGGVAGGASCARPVEQRVDNRPEDRIDRIDRNLRTACLALLPR